MVNPCSHPTWRAEVEGKEPQPRFAWFLVVQEACSVELLPLTLELLFGSQFWQIRQIEKQNKTLNIILKRK